MADCGFGIIHWCNFDWQSFSTLFTGIAAVVGAVIVGLKQTGISSKQTDILDRQVELEEAKLRADLFERRLETYEATADFVIHISSMPESDPKAEARIQRFNSKMRESQFLFSDQNVYQTLLGFWDKGNAARLDRALSFAEHEEGRKHDPERTKRIMEYPTWSFQTADTLAELFRHDLSILRETKKE
ncbi:hypothetical protein [Sphingobium boeckii]|uniref:Uncharacterized protein n=1 Tax=Sphingobium boeckii TaxID=1082345 RepID=A0A7W9ALF7_9SPHN|nr:hypothetical protein [Sphingobium boeckii]MBB5687656.1 hypothetical protein [Sphingobium boeckii]